MENENLEVQDIAQEEETQENETLTVESNEEEVVKDIQQSNPETPNQDEVEQKTFTQDELNKIMRSRLDRDRLALYNRYGVKDKEGLDILVGKAQSYDVMKERYDGLKEENSKLKEKLAFVSNGINPDREEDIKAHFKGKGIEFNEEVLSKELETHPEWKKVVEVDNTPKTTIEVLGAEHKHKNVQETEAEKMKRIYGV